MQQSRGPGRRCPTGRASPSCSRSARWRVAAPPTRSDFSQSPCGMRVRSLDRGVPRLSRCLAPGLSLRPTDISPHLPCGREDLVVETDQEPGPTHQRPTSERTRAPKKNVVTDLVALMHMHFWNWGRDCVDSQFYATYLPQYYGRGMQCYCAHWD